MSGFSRRGVLGSGLAVATGASAASTTVRATTAESSLDAAANLAVQKARAAGACPGAAVSIWRDGKPLLAKSYGIANLETGTPLAARSIFRIGSLTKQFMAAAIVKLFAEGRLQLDEPIAHYLDSFVPLTPVTFYELLTHTAGLHSDDAGPVCLSPGTKGKSQVDLARAIAAQPKPFDFPPGTAWLYSNANYIVLGAAVEKITGKALSEAMRKLIFVPLRLTNTAFDRSDDVVPGRVSGYTPGGTRGGFVHAAYIPIEEAGGAGAMRSTAEDLCAWHHRLFGGALFGARYVNMMTVAGRLRSGQPSGMHRYSPKDAAYGDVQYGFGLLIPPPFKGHRSVLHYGAINGFASCLETYIDIGLTLAVLCNADVNSNLPIRRIRHIVIDQLL
jgi:CubicO group peptidase (beta-lactamase class C family)